MSSPYEDPKKRPPAVNIPPLPLPRPVQAANIPQMNCDGQQQRSARNASNSTQHGPRNMGSIPLTSPLEQDTARLPPSQSQTIKSHASAKSTLTNIADQAHASPRLSDHSSTMGSQRGATTRSRHSERSYHSAAAAQAQLEALDERTTRGRMEERNEHKLFKMTGQVPPTPITGMCSSTALRRCPQDTDRLPQELPTRTMFTLGPRICELNAVLSVKKSRRLVTNRLRVPRRRCLGTCRSSNHSAGPQVPRLFPQCHQRQHKFSGQQHGSLI